MDSFQEISERINDLLSNGKIGAASMVLANNVSFFSTTQFSKLNKQVVNCVSIKSNFPIKITTNKNGKCHAGRHMSGGHGHH